MTQDEWKFTFGDNLDSILKDRHMSQKELAKMCDISQGMISDYVNGFRAPNIFAVINIAYALDTDIDELVDVGDTID